MDTTFYCNTATFWSYVYSRLLQTYKAMDAAIFAKGTQICYIAVSVAMGNRGNLWPAFLWGVRNKVPWDHQTVCLSMCLAPSPPHLSLTPVGFPTVKRLFRNLVQACKYYFKFKFCGKIGEIRQNSVSLFWYANKCVWNIAIFINCKYGDDAHFWHNVHHI